MNANDRCMQSYNKILRDNPLLSNEDEINLLSILDQHKTGKAREKAREKLFKSNLRLVLDSAHKYASRYKMRIPLEDFISAGNEGLCIAIDRYDIKHKTKLSTYSIPWIRLKIVDLINSLNSPVYTPLNIVAKSYRYKGIKEEDENFNDKEMMDKLEVTEKQLLRIKLAEYKTFSLDAPISDDSNGMEMKDMIADDSAIKVDSILYTKEVRDIIKNAISKLKPIQQDILTSRYLNEDKENLNDVGKRLGMTGERVRQIEVKTLKLLRKRMKNRARFDA